MSSDLQAKYDELSKSHALLVGEVVDLRRERDRLKLKLTGLLLLFGDLRRLVADADRVGEGRF